jgi:hypothetical protein
MDTYGKNKSCLLIVLWVSVLPAYAGIPSELSGLVEPGGVEIPTIVNVFGPEKVNDVNNVKEIFRTANDILKQADVQFAVKWISTGITEIGNGDSRLSEAEGELRQVLLGSMYELERPYGPGRGLKINIADDIWVERPELVFWYDIFYPVAFLESSVSPEQMGQILAREICIIAGLSPSTDPNNLTHPDGTGVFLDENQSAAIRELAKQVGLLRSPLAEGYVPDVLKELRYKKPGALFYSEDFALRGDYWADVLIENAEGSQVGYGGVDLEAFIAKGGRIGDADAERSLILKFYFGVGELIEDTYIDTYLRTYNHNNHVTDGNDITYGDPYETFEAVIGTGVTTFSPPFAGVINLSDGSEWFEFSDIQPQVDYDKGRTKVKVEIPFSVLTPHLPENVLESLNNGWGLEMLVTANSYSLDALGGLIYQEDYIDGIKMGAIPRTLPSIHVSSSLAEPLPNAATGFRIHSVKPLDLPDPNQVTPDYLEQLFNGSIPLAEEGMQESEFVNLYNFSDFQGNFTADNGYPDETFPVPSSVDDSSNFATKVTANIYLTEGLHIIGVPGKGYANLEIGGINVGTAFLRRPPEDYNNVDNVNGNNVNEGLNFRGENDNNKMHILTRRDWAFDVEADGYYNLRLFSWTGTDGASLELNEVLKDGTRILFGDVANGGTNVFLPD